MNSKYSYRVWVLSRVVIGLVLFTGVETAMAMFVNTGVVASNADLIVTAIGTATLSNAFSGV